MNRAILSGTLVAHIGDSVTESGMDIHQATFRTFEPYGSGNGGREEYHPCVFFGSDAKLVRELALGAKLLLQGANRWNPVPGVHIHAVEVL